MLLVGLNLRSILTMSITSYSRGVTIGIVKDVLGVGGLPTGQVHPSDNGEDIDPYQYWDALVENIGHFPNPWTGFSTKIYGERS